ncbi:three-Cys-motif partner protein TcmP, partial [Paenibacillus elgii]
MSWEMKAHTRAKHVVLENYLKAWFPIMAFSNERILYIDGFAGPGIYSTGEDGSPIKALKIANEIFQDHFSKLQKKDFVFVFIEQDEDSFESLSYEINRLDLPKEFRIVKIN